MIEETEGQTVSVPPMRKALTIRMPADLHARLWEAAKTEQRSVNNFVVRLLTGKLAEENE